MNVPFVSLGGRTAGAYTAKPDQLARPLRAPKLGLAALPSGPSTRKDSWSGGSRKASGSCGLGGDISAAVADEVKRG